MRQPGRVQLRAIARVLQLERVFASTRMTRARELAEIVARAARSDRRVTDLAQAVSPEAHT